MNFIACTLNDLFIIEPKIWADNRGYFYESYNAKAFAANGIEAVFVQDNQSLSQKGALRGLHAQAPPYAQGKLVRVLQGSVLDIVVDIRKNSSTFGQYFSIELSGKNHRQLWIPPGFLHGFLTLEDQTIFTYKVTNYYDKDAEIGVIWNDPLLNINWGTQIKNEDLLLSGKDLALQEFSSFVSPF
ncbi:MAG: dTDP-4-dehydrorhamnose 3,5-epimerase [Bacteroidota bacterium]